MCALFEAYAWMHCNIRMVTLLHKRFELPNKADLGKGELLKAANSCVGELLRGGELWNKESSGAECFCR